jgi:hypothetical protein
MACFAKNRMKFLDFLCKEFTLFLFFILPSRIASIFINLSILAIIYKIRDVNFSLDNINKSKLSKFFKTYINDDILLLPSYTTYWFWDERFLNKKILIAGKEMALCEAIKNREIFFKNFRKIMNEFIENIPLSLKIKLGLNNKRNRIYLKHSLMEILMFS